MPHSLLDGTPNHSVYAIGWGAPSALNLQHGRPATNLRRLLAKKRCMGERLPASHTKNSNPGFGSRGLQSIICAKISSYTLSGGGVRFAAELRRTPLAH